MSSLDCDSNRVRSLSISSQDDIDFAAPCQRAWQQNVQLIQSDKTALRSGEQDLSVNAAKFRADGSERAAITKACAEQDQIDLFVGCADINWYGDEFIRRRIEARDRFIDP